jgi:hypothetical protein
MVEVAAGYQIVTRPELPRMGAPAVPRADDDEAVGSRRWRRSRSSPYKQPVTGAGDRRDSRRQHRPACLGTLVERKLIKIVGRKQVVGRPVPLRHDARVPRSASV